MNFVRNSCRCCKNTISGTRTLGNDTRTAAVDPCFFFIGVSIIMFRNRNCVVPLDGTLFCSCMRRFWRLFHSAPFLVSWVCQSSERFHLQWWSRQECSWTETVPACCRVFLSTGLRNRFQFGDSSKLVIPCFTEWVQVWWYFQYGGIASYGNRSCVIYRRYVTLISTRHELEIFSIGKISSTIIPVSRIVNNMFSLYIYRTKLKSL